MFGGGVLGWRRCRFVGEDYFDLVSSGFLKKPHLRFLKEFCTKISLIIRENSRFFPTVELRPFLNLGANVAEDCPKWLINILQLFIVLYFFQ